LIGFLTKLQASPYNPVFEERDGFYAGEFAAGRVVFWKLINNKSGDLLRIDLLEIEYFKIG
jgi:hypothetical protein